MRAKYMSTRRSDGPPVNAQFQHPTHQTTLIQGSQDEIDYAGSSYPTTNQIDSKPSTLGVDPSKTMMTSGFAPDSSTDHQAYWTFADPKAQTSKVIAARWRDTSLSRRYLVDDLALQQF
jgi:hypothetical protein